MQDLGSASQRAEAGLRRQEACRDTQVPQAVMDLLADLRRHLQEECEPPVYVSDRRLIKALALLQARAQV